MVSHAKAQTLAPARQSYHFLSHFVGGGDAQHSPGGAHPFPTRVGTDITPGEHTVLVHGSRRQGESSPASLPHGCSRSPETGSHMALIYSPIDPS